MKFKPDYRLLLTIVLGCLMYSCELFQDKDPDQDETFDPVFTYESNKITAEFSYDFGFLIANHQDHLIASDYEDIYIFEYDASGIELIQTIDFNATSGIWSMIVHQSSLIFGHADAYGTGTVYVYTRNGDSWDPGQEIHIGREEDLFGTDIDIEGDIMVIGASAPWMDGLTSIENNDEGRAFIYQLQEGTWIQKHEFLAEEPEGDDRFGTCVAIQNGLVLVGSPLIPMHIYRLEEDLEFLRTEEIYARVIEHSENNFLVSGDYELWSFILDADGSFTETTVSDFNESDISRDGEIIEIKDTLAIIDVVDEIGIPSGCYLFKYANQQWTKEMVFSTDPGEDCTFHGLAFSDLHAIVGGRSLSDSRYSNIYFKSLPD